MKKLSLVILSILNIYKLSGDPWNLDQETKDLFANQINSSYQKHVDKALSEGKTIYLIDLERRVLNFYENTCSYCQNLKKSTQFNFDEKLCKFNFIKKVSSQIKAHCWGTTLFFVDHLLSYPELLTHSCADIISEVSKASDFEEKIHCFSTTQHPYYNFQDSEVPLELNPKAMKLFFKILLNRTPSNYFFIPLSADNAMIDPVSIYATLKNLPNKLIIVGYSNGDIKNPENISNHCIAISTHPKKLFVFDSNLGIYQFPDIETLSRDAGKVLKGQRFRWLTAFSIDKES